MLTKAQMAKLVDALVSGTSGRKAVQVRVLFWALNKKRIVYFLLSANVPAQMAKLVDAPA